MIKLVWDMSAIVNFKEPNADGYSPGGSLWKDLSDGWIPGPYLNIIPAIAAFEVSATVSRVQRDGRRMLREFYLMGDSEILYPIDDRFVELADPLVAETGFDRLYGADLILACIAKLEGAWLVTLDSHFRAVQDQITVLDLNDSRDSPHYRRRFGI